MPTTLDNTTTKYNWWTGQDDKKHISDYIQVSYVFCHGGTFELISIIKTLPYEVLERAFEYVKDDTFAFKDKRKKVVSYLLKLKKDGII